MGVVEGTGLLYGWARKAVGKASSLQRWGLAALLAAAAVSHGAALPRTGAFAKSTTVERKGAFVDEIVADVARQTGLRLVTGSNLVERRATLFASNRPAWLVLERLASTIEADWMRRDDGRYTLAVSGRVAAQEAREASEKAANARRRGQARLTAMAAQSRRPMGELIELAESLDRQRSKEIDQLRTEATQEEASRRLARIGRLSERLQEVPSDPRSYAIAKLLDRLDSEQLRRLFSGEVLLASDRRSFGWPRLDASWLAFGDEERPAEERIVLAQFDPASGAFESHLVFMLPGGYSQKTLWRDSDLTGPEVHISLEDRDRDDPWIATIGVVPTLAGGSPARLRTLDDLAEALWKQSSVPCVVESQRRELYLGGAELAGPLDAWLDHSVVRASVCVRLEDGWFLARPRDRRSWRAVAPSERALRKLEELKNPGLDDYAAFAASLTPAQASTFRDGGFVAEAQALRCAAAIPALRIWHELDQSARTRALRREPIRFVEMGVRAQDLYRSALVEAAFARDDYSWPGTSDDPLGVPPYVLIALLEPDARGDLALYVDQLETATQTAVQGSATVTGEPDQLPSGSKPVSSQRTLELKFMLGLDASRSAVFPMSLELPPQTESKPSG